MDGASFDAMTRQQAGAGPHRISLFSLGTAELRAAVAGWHTVRAKKKHGKKKHKNNSQTQPAPQECPPVPVDLCIGQAQPCIDILTVACNGDPECQDSIACCSHFETCDFGGFFNCLLVSQSN
jgi:hypothetical protein